MKRIYNIAIISKSNGPKLSLNIRWPERKHENRHFQDENYFIITLLN